MAEFEKLGVQSVLYYIFFSGCSGLFYVGEYFDNIGKTHWRLRMDFQMSMHVNTEQYRVLETFNFSTQSVVGLLLEAWHEKNPRAVHPRSSLISVFDCYLRFQQDGTL
jgi:hypothetical protein